MDLDLDLQFGWYDALVILLFIVVLLVSGRVLQLRTRAQQLKNTRIPQEKENLRKTKNLESRMKSVRSESSRQVENQREMLQSLETVLTKYLREAGYTNAEDAVNPSILRSRNLEGTSFTRGGIRFTIEGLPLPYLVKTLHMMESRLPALKTKNIQLNRIVPSRTGPDVIEKGSVTLVYYLPEE